MKAAGESMRAAVFERPGSIVVRDVSRPRCDPAGIVARVVACGICGSDVRNYRVGLRSGKAGQVMGHEISAEVVEVGPECSRFSVGDSVAIAPDVSCGVCHYCSVGLVNLCDDHRMIGTHWPGGFAQFIALPAEVLSRGMVHAIPKGLSHRHAALSEPLSSVLATQESARIGPGSGVAVFGDGPVGCMHVEIARSRGAAPVIQVGRRRLALAAPFKADLSIDVNRGDVPQQIRAATGGLGVQTAIIATPAAETQELGVESVAKRGTVVLFGGLPRESPFTRLDANRIHYNELRLVGSFSYPAGSHREALEAIRDGLISAERYISRVVPLQGIEEAIQASERGEVLKVLVDPWM